MLKIVHYYPRAYIGNGGVTIAMWRLVRSLKNKFEVHIAYDQSNYKKQPLEVVGVKKIPTKHYFNGKFQIPSNFLKNFDQETIVFIHSGLLLKNIFAALYAYKINAKVVLIPHGCYHPTLLKYNSFIKKFFIFFEKFFFKKLFFIQAFTKLDKKNILKVYKKNHIKILPVPVSFKKDKKLTNKKKDYFSYVGRYDIETKGIDLLINAYKLVPEKIRIPIIMHGTKGKDTDIEDVKRLITEKNMQEYFIINGPIYGKKKENFLNSSLMSLQLSRWDAFPLSIWESISLKVPCLVSNRNASSEIIKKNNFGIVTDLKITSIKNNLVKILLNKRKFKKYIKNTNYIDKNLSFKNISNKYYEIFI